MRAARVLYYVAIALLVIVAGAVAWAVRFPEMEPIEAANASQFSPETITRGAELAAIGNCGVCHTPDGGAALAGGVPIPTPFGTIHSTNITPDPETGIGRWSEAAFRRSMRDGIARDGSHLYPAFPYDHFTLTTDEDIAAIYAYLMTREPVSATAPENELPFPLNIRPVVAGWNLLYLERGPYQPDASQDEAWNRGAYLAEGLGHCGSCHTPRNALGAEEEDRRFAGGFGEGWVGPALDASSPSIAPWSVEELQAYLRHGWIEDHGIALGPMAEVAHDLSEVPAEDVAAIATYIASYLPAEGAGGEEAVAAAIERSWTPVQLASFGADATEAGGSGAVIFAGACATCHYRGGRLPITRPVALGLSTSVALDDPTNFLQVVVNGIHPEEGSAGPIMPPFGSVLTDGQIAELAAYVRTHFTDAPAWTDLPSAIERVRNETAGP